MMESEWFEAAKQLKRLRKKAELCRYAHERMRSAACLCRRVTEFVGALLSLLLFGAGLLLYRNADPAYEEWIMLSIVVLPPLALFVQRISRIFGWADKETRCEIAVHLWGQWIREVDFLERQISRISEERARESMYGMEEKYKACMDKTPAIPARNFLGYKSEFRRYRLLSEKIDSADENGLAEIKRKIGGAWGKRS